MDIRFIWDDYQFAIIKNLTEEEAYNIKASFVPNSNNIYADCNVICSYKKTCGEYTISINKGITLLAQIKSISGDLCDKILKNCSHKRFYSLYPEILESADCNQGDNMAAQEKERKGMEKDMLKSVELKATGNKLSSHYVVAVKKGEERQYYNVPNEFI